MDALTQDIRFTLRMLLRSKGFTLFTIATLALGIGANTALFTVINGVLLRALPFADADRLVDLPSKADEPFPASDPNLRDWQAQSRLLEGIAGYSATSVNLMVGGEAERVEGTTAGDAFFRVLGVSAARGRVWREADRTDNGVVLSDRLWHRRFGGDPAIVGRDVLINGAARTIIGIMPPSFRLGDAELWLRMPPNPQARRGNFNLRAVGRLAPNASVVAAQQEMDAIGERLAEQYPGNGVGALVRPLHNTIVGDARKPLFVLLGACGLVLLIACVNVASLMLARSDSRRRELAVRASLGAMRGRLVRQLLTEAMTLSLAAGVVGLLIAAWGTDVLLGFIPGAVPRAAEISVDARVVGFAMLIALGTGVLFGLLPAFRASNLRMTALLNEGGRATTAGVGRQRVRNVLIVSEIALALIPLIGAGLLLRSLGNLLDVDSGFRSDNVITANYALPPRVYAGDQQIVQYAERLVSGLSALPGVEHAGVITPAPLSGDNESASFEIEGRPLPQGVETWWSGIGAASPGYFEAAGIPLVLGRGFSEHDRANSTRVALVDRVFVQKYFGGQNPIGQRIVMGFDRANPREIVGVVGSVRHAALQAEPEPQIYFPYAQQPIPFAAVFIRSTSDAQLSSTALRRIGREIDAQIPLYRIQSFDQGIAASLARPRFTAMLLITFAVCALIIAAAGVYGVLSFIVIERNREIGIRVALGAQQRDILRLFVGHGTRLAALGILFGIAGALSLSRALSGLLYDTTPRDALTFAAAGTVVAAVALLACYIPARRAARVDPVQTLS